MRCRAVKTTVDGIVFDSMTEARRYVELKLLIRAGEIEKLQCHPKFEIEVNGVRICAYTPDFSYIEMKTKKPHIEDVKGFKRSQKTGKLLPRVDREFGVKRKLMLAVFGLDVEIV